MEKNEDRFSRETVRFVIIFLLILSIFELFMIIGYLDIINDKNNYIINIEQEKYLNKYYVQEALKNKFSKVYMVSTLKLKLNHYGELKGE